MNPLNDKEFLRRLDLENVQEKFAKITLLTIDELPVREIQGRITQGSINIDGNSALRRTCSLTMIPEEFKSGDIYLGLKNKFKLAVGITNDIDARYPKIIWFPQGLYVFTSINETVNAQGISLAIQGKDKMCLLNGEMGGIITQETDFGKQEHYTTDDYKEIEYVDIDVIVKNIVNIFGGESLHNIILNDIDKYAVELLRYKGDSPMYMFKNTKDNTISNVTFNDKMKVYIKGEEKPVSSADIIYDSFTTTADTGSNPTEITFSTSSSDKFTVIKIVYDEDVGYRATKLTYPGDLIAKAGETITSVLDKIKNIFSDFEYFYDIDGKFIFQKKRTFVNTSWNGMVNNDKGIYVEPNAYSSAITYSFIDNVLLSAFSNQPNFMNLKNDYSIWGTRESSSGEKVPIHMRYAIKKKPVYYKNFKNEVYSVENGTDWREIIYQMAIDYYDGNNGYYANASNFLKQLSINNKLYYPDGITSYEDYYADMQGFWRQLYNPKAIRKSGNEITLNNIKGYVGSLTYNTKTGFNVDVEKNPAALNFWIDFLDSDGELNKYSIDVIGKRQKVVNSNDVTAIYLKDVPNVIFPSNKSNKVPSELSDGYTKITLPSGTSNYFAISPRKKSAKDELDSLLYQHAYTIESITLTTLPIYYLEPNTRIFVSDKDTGVNGEYILNKIIIPLTYNGTSSLNAVKAVERIY